MSRSEAKAMQPFTMLRISLGIVYFLFGFLKLFPDLSPAEMLAGETLSRVSGQLLSSRDALRVLGAAECAIGVSFLLGIRPKVVFAIFLGHMAGTVLPLFVLPELMFKVAPFAPTMHGQYVIKNLIIAAAGWAVLSSMGNATGRMQPSTG